LLDLEGVVTFDFCEEELRLPDAGFVYVFVEPFAGTLYVVLDFGLVYSLLDLGFW